MEKVGGNQPPNPLEPAVRLEKPSSSSLVDETAHPQSIQTAEDSAITRAEKYERHGVGTDAEESPTKRRKLDHRPGTEDGGPTKSERVKGVAPIRPESGALPL
jgi:hypothetical protein